MEGAAAAMHMSASGVEGGIGGCNGVVMPEGCSDPTADAHLPQWQPHLQLEAVPEAQTQQQSLQQPQTQPQQHQQLVQPSQCSQSTTYHSGLETNPPNQQHTHANSQQSAQSSQFDHAQQYTQYEELDALALTEKYGMAPEPSEYMGQQYSDSSGQCYGRTLSHQYGQCQAQQYGQSQHFGQTQQYGGSQTEQYGQVQQFSPSNPQQIGQSQTQQYGQQFPQGQNQSQMYGQQQTYHYGQGQQFCQGQTLAQNQGHGQTQHYGQGQLPQYAYNEAQQQNQPQQCSFNQVQMQMPTMQHYNPNQMSMQRSQAQQIGRQQNHGAQPNPVYQNYQGQTSMPNGAQGNYVQQGNVSASTHIGAQGNQGHRVGGCTPVDRGGAQGSCGQQVGIDNGFGYGQQENTGTQSNQGGADGCSGQSGGMTSQSGPDSSLGQQDIPLPVNNAGLEMAAKQAIAELLGQREPSPERTGPPPPPPVERTGGPPSGSGFVGGFGTQQGYQVPGNEPQEVKDRLFISKVPASLTAEDLRRHFMQFGDLTDVYLPMMPGSTAHKGFAFVQFAHPSSLGRAIVHQPHEVRGMVLTLDIAAPRQAPAPIVGVPPGGNVRLFLTKVTVDISTRDLQLYFQQFGELTDCYVPPGNKGIGFCSYKDPISAQRVLAMTTHEIKPGRIIGVSQAFDRPAMGTATGKGMKGKGVPPVGGVNWGGAAMGFQGRPGPY